MKKISTRDFRRNLARLVDSADPTLITRRGNVRALLVPLHHDRGAARDVSRLLFLALSDGIKSQLDAQGVTDADVEAALASMKMRARVSSAASRPKRMARAPRHGGRR